MALCAKLHVLEVVLTGGFWQGHVWAAQEGPAAFGQLLRARGGHSTEGSPLDVPATEHKLCPPAPR